MCRALSKQTAIPLLSERQSSVALFLTYNNCRLELHVNDQKGPDTLPFYIDFLSGASFYRYKTNRTINQPLAKAVGIKPGFRPDICDLTAGFGNDGFVFASMGCNVTLVERSPVIWALLDDGLKRAKLNSKTGFLFDDKISLFNADSTSFLSKSANRYSSVYLDPMYPHRRKASLNKLKMRHLRSIVGDDTDSPELLKIARKHAIKRTVVKRPSSADYLTTETPSYCVKSKKHRYDIYLSNHL